MKTKPDLGFWKLWNLSFGFFGVQIAYALQSANVSRIFTTIGADPHDLSYFWILPPLMGLIVQPIVGMFSDRTWNRFGRRLPYLIFGALIAVIVMCLLPNAGSFHFTVQTAILVGLIALMLLDTSINMAMQPFKMLVGDMVNEKQKGLAYSIQSFLCNAGSVVGFIFPICLGLFGLSNVAPAGVVPQTVIWSFYLGAAILLICVVYSLVKIKEWPPHVYNEYNGVSENKDRKSESLFKLLVKAPSTFWSVGLVQFFCWFAFLFMWTYTTNTVAFKAFDTPTIRSVAALTSGENTYKGNYIFINDTTMLLSHNNVMVKGVRFNDSVIEGNNIIINDNDTVVENGAVVLTSEGQPKAEFNKAIPVNSFMVDGEEYNSNGDIEIVDQLYGLSGKVSITTAAICSTDADGKLNIEDTKTYKDIDAKSLAFETKTVLNAASPQYNDAGNWVGLLYAVQALGSVVWALVLPRFKSRKFSYSLSLLLGGIGFVMMSFMTNQYLLFIAFILIGCAWAAMLAWPFTILTNSLHSGNIGSYLGLFNCTICIPQIVAALAGGWILGMMSTPNELAPEYMMMTVAGISLAIGALCVFNIKEGSSATAPKENIPVSEDL